MGRALMGRDGIEFGGMSWDCTGREDVWVWINATCMAIEARMMQGWVLNRSDLQFAMGLQSLALPSSDEVRMMGSQKRGVE